MIPPKCHELRERVTLIIPKVPYNVQGPGTDFKTFRSNIPAKFEPLGGNAVESTQETTEFAQDYNVWIRYIRGVTPFMQVTWASKNNRQLTFTAAPEEMENKRWLLLHCQEIIGKKI
ncbi:MAG: head-tail adaptor protein [Candidatus Paceibacterota bacterium]|jgi:head-tail adaptor